MITYTYYYKLTCKLTSIVNQLLIEFGSKAIKQNTTENEFILYFCLTLLASCTVVNIVSK